MRLVICTTVESVVPPDDGGGDGETLSEVWVDVAVVELPLLEDVCELEVGDACV